MGLVRKAYKDQIGVMIVELQGNDKSFVSCGVAYDPDNVNKWKSLKEGEKVSLQGKCVGKSEDHVTINSCEFAEW